MTKQINQTPANQIIDGETSNILPFPGNPKIYKQIAIWGSIGLHAYLFIGFWAIKNFLAGEKWPHNWHPLAFAVVSAIVFAWFSFRWIMRLDAQYGRGSGWILEATSIKLPRELPKKAKN